ncbi:glycosyltransferase [Novosphingobium kaempferiae]|uniref:glycosyltransferase n=1 Tax=Novosphingobium kaempferiae TaxID=2896849 RepID=UPI001E5B5C05|nr:glycosyltransferase [Novosphingobium kaempferiae]
MTFAKPVVGLAVGGVVDVVDHGVNGLLVERDDPALLGEAIARLVDDPVARMRMGQAGRALYEQKFNIEKMVEGTENCFRKVAFAR